MECDKERCSKFYEQTEFCHISMVLGNGPHQTGNDEAGLSVHLSQIRQYNTCLDRVTQNLD